MAVVLQIYLDSPQSYYNNHLYLIFASRANRDWFHPVLRYEKALYTLFPQYLLTQS